MKIILVMGKPDEKSEEILNKLKSLGFSCVVSTKADEVDQLGLQMGKVSVVFFDPKIAHKFFQENIFQGFELFKMLLVSKTPKITPDVQTKLNKISLNLYSPSTVETMVKELEGFFSGEKEDASLNIKFSANED